MAFSVVSEERATGNLASDKLEALLLQIEREGYAVVEGVVSPATCELLRAAIVEDAHLVRAQTDVTPHETATGQGHLQLGLRRSSPYVKADLLANLIIENVVAAVLGEGAWLGFYNGNVNLPGSVHQPVHYDRPFSWRTPEAAERDGQSWPPPTTTLSCSVALTDITEDNGATEIYPGTHLETAVTDWPLGERPEKHPELLDRWSPPARMSIPAGGVCFRDPRMWHRGVPNTSNEVRPMIALTYHAQQCRHWRGRLVKNLESSVLASCQQDPTLKIQDDGGLGDGRLVFDGSAREVLGSVPSPHRVNRNLRFLRAQQQANHFLDAHLMGGARIVDAGPLLPVSGNPE